MQPQNPPQDPEELIAALNENDLAKLAKKFPEFLGGSPTVLDLNESFIESLQENLRSAFKDKRPENYDRRWIRGLQSIAEIAGDNNFSEMKGTLMQIRQLYFPNAS